MEEETPYSLALRLAADGANPSAIEAALKARGLDSDDVVAVLGAVSRKTGKLEFGQHLVRIAPADFRSIGTCPRCGGFSCRDCAPEGGFGGKKVCRTCMAEPAWRQQRLAEYARMVSWALVALPLPTVALLALIRLVPDLGLGWALGFVAKQGNLALALALVALLVPFLVLSAIQNRVKQPWPGVAAVVLGGFGVLGMFGLADFGFDASIAALGIPATVVLFLLPELWARFETARETGGPPTAG